MVEDRELALTSTVRVGVTLKYVGELCLPLGACMLVPAVGCVVLDEAAAALPYASLGLLLMGVGALARRIRGVPDLRGSEALAVSGLVFVVGAAAMSLPLMARGIAFEDAVFEAVSGITTTGLSTLTSAETMPRSQLLTRAWMQWTGGLGIVILSIAFAIEPGIAARRLGGELVEEGDLVTSVRHYARRALVVYGTLTLAGIGALLLLGAAPFEAVALALAAISTGGFALFDASLGPYGPWLQSAVLAIAFFGAISLPLYAMVWRRGWRSLQDDVELRWLAVLVIGFAIASWCAARLHGDLSTLDALLLAASAQTTAGFATVDVAELPPLSKAILLAPMLIGGSQGSTAGGIKLFRLLLMLRVVHWLVARVRMPRHAVFDPRLQGERLEPAEIQRAFAITLLFAMVTFVSWLVFVAAGHDPLDSLFEVVSALGTVGLSAGVTAPDLEPYLKGVLCVNMLLGRVEILALILLVSPWTWIGRR